LRNSKTTDISKTVERVALKMKISNIERCLNCELFSDCPHQKEEMITCEKFSQLPIGKQLIVVSLEQFGKLHGIKNQASLCSF
jgi:hypothetical protein